MLLLAFIIRTTATTKAIASAFGNESHIIFIPFENLDNNQARGNTTTHNLKSEITNELTPHPKAWKTPWIAIFHPANKNPTEIIRIAKIQSLAVSSDKPNNGVSIK